MMNLKKLVFPIVNSHPSKDYSIVIMDSAGEIYSWNDINVQFPIVKYYFSENYALMMVDSAGTTHYWDEDGTYDGFSVDGCIDMDTRTNLN